MSMTTTEARGEIKRLYEEADVIDRRYPDGLTPEANHEDYEQLKKLLTDIDSLENKLPDLVQMEQQRERITKGLRDYARPAITGQIVQQSAQGDDREARQKLSPGDQFTQSPEYLAVKRSGRLNSSLEDVRLSVAMKDGTSLVLWQKAAKQLEAAEQKALVYGSGASVGGAFVANDLQPGSLNILQRQITVLDLINRLQTDSDTVEYVREDTFTNAAAMTAEATATTGTTGSKPESTLAFSTQTAPVRTLAHWIPVTNRMLSDAPAIRGIINSRLLLGLALALETQMLTGDGTGENFTGILNAGIQTRGLGADNVMDSLFRARTAVRVTGHANPTAIVLHPNDFEAIRLTRENAATATLGQYLMGPPALIGPVTVWGLPVVESEALTENTGLVGDFSLGSTLFDREQAMIRVGLINDQFTRNMQTILAELRAAFVNWRPSAYCRVTGI